MKWREMEWRDLNEVEQKQIKMIIDINLCTFYFIEYIEERNKKSCSCSDAFLHVSISYPGGGD